MVRYTLDKDISTLNSSPDFKGEKIAIPSNHMGFGWIVNILEHKDDIFKLRVYVQNGEFIDGYISSLLDPLNITNRQELFDGRFNS